MYLRETQGSEAKSRLDMRNRLRRRRGLCVYGKSLHDKPVTGLGMPNIIGCPVPESLRIAYTSANPGKTAVRNKSIAIRNRNCGAKARETREFGPIGPWETAMTSS